MMVYPDCATDAVVAPPRSQLKPSERTVTIAELLRSESTSVTFEHPRDLPPGQTSHPSTGLSYPLGCFRVAPAVLVGAHAVITTVSRGVLAEQNAGTLVDESFISLPAPLKPGEPHLASAVSLCAACSYNFYHWMIESLPKVILAESCGFQGTYIVPASEVSPFLHETLQLVGVHPSRVLHMDYAIVTVDDLWIPTFFHGQSCAEAPDLLMAYRNKVLGSLGKVALPSFQKLFLARAPGAASREVKNHDGVVSTVGRYGFSTVSMETLPVVFQIHLAMNAQACIGIHGAGMTHVAWMPRGASVLEIFPSSHTNPVYQPICNALDQSYDSLVFKSSASGVVEIDCDLLAQKIESYF